MRENRKSCVEIIPRGKAALALLVTGLLLILISIAGSAGTAQAISLPANAAAPALQAGSDGAAIFSEKCTPCHTIGKGKLVGPDLKDVTKRRDPAWIERFISDPTSMFASDPTAQQLLKENNDVRMPNLGLSKDDVAKLAAYLANPGEQPAVEAAPAAAPGIGDRASGQMLFTGQTALTNGGPPCITCHTVGGTGNLGGGALGPDLTHVTQRLGQPGVTAALKNIVFPTMLGPFSNRPLTPKEQADLVAFLIFANEQEGPVLVITPGRLTQYSLEVLGIATAGAAGLFGVLFFFRARQKQRIPTHLPVRKS